MSLKNLSSDGLTRHWSPTKCLEPFYRGERSEISKNEEILVCLDSENIAIVSWESGQVLGRVLDEVSSCWLRCSLCCMISSLTEPN